MNWQHWWFAAWASLVAINHAWGMRQLFVELVRCRQELEGLNKKLKTPTAHRFKP